MAWMSSRTVQSDSESESESESDVVDCEVSIETKRPLTLFSLSSRSRPHAPACL